MKRWLHRKLLQWLGIEPVVIYNDVPVPQEALDAFIRGADEWSAAMDSTPAHRLAPNDSPWIQ